jgi:hypothetical protein
MKTSERLEKLAVVTLISSYPENPKNEFLEKTRARAEVFLQKKWNAIFYSFYPRSKTTIDETVKALYAEKIKVIPLPLPCELFGCTEEEIKTLEAAGKWSKVYPEMIEEIKNRLKRALLEKTKLFIEESDAAGGCCNILVATDRFIIPAAKNNFPESKYYMAGDMGEYIFRLSNDGLKIVGYDHTSA